MKSTCSNQLTELEKNFNEKMKEEKDELNSFLQRYYNEKSSMMLINRIEQRKSFKALADIVRLYQKEEEIINESLCIICVENKRNTLLIPCKHVVLCADCSKLVDKCPICKEIVESKIDKIYI